MAIAEESTARAIIAQGKSLLVCQGMREPFVHLPGGHIEKGETPEAALRRELQEEIGARVISTQKLGVIETKWPRLSPTGIVEVHETMHLYGVDAAFTPNHRGEYWLSCYWVLPAHVLDQLVPREIHPYLMQMVG